MKEMLRVAYVVISIVITGYSLMGSESNGASALASLSYDGTEKSLEKIRDAIQPFIKNQNQVALTLYRDALYGLSLDVALSETEKPSQLENALSRKTIDDWVSVVRKRSGKGDLFFKTALGTLYYSGVGVEKNSSKCVALWDEAASGGYAAANYKLGNTYFYGLLADVGLDREKGLKYLRTASELGSALADYNLGCIHNEGQLGSIDTKKAFDYWLKAAESGHAMAQRNVGGCYTTGRGVMHNRALGKEWLFKAAEAGDKGAHSWLDEYYVSDYARWQSSRQAPKSITATINMNEKSADEGETTSQVPTIRSQSTRPAEPSEGPIHRH